MPITCYCLNCNKPFSKYPSQTRIYCSKECKYAAIAKRVAEKSNGYVDGTKAIFKIKCRYCGCAFIRPASKKTKVYCSKKCYNASRSRGYAICENCGEKFYKRSKSPTSKNRFCSSACFLQWQNGKNAPGWKGGISYIRSDSWPKIRQAILKRDEYTCQRCGKKPKGLHVHHINPWNQTHDNSPENLITLCCHCHRKIEHNLPNKLDLINRPSSLTPERPLSLNKDS